MEEEELKKEIERIEEIIESFKLDIKRNAENKYDAYTHSNLIKSIENSENRIKELKAELKGFQAGKLAEREKFYYWLFDLKKGQKKWSTYQLIKIQKKFEELTKKVSEETTE